MRKTTAQILTGALTQRFAHTTHLHYLYSYSVRACAHVCGCSVLRVQPQPRGAPGTVAPLSTRRQLPMHDGRTRLFIDLMIASKRHCLSHASLRRIQKGRGTVLATNKSGTSRKKAAPHRRRHHRERVQLRPTARQRLHDRDVRARPLAVLLPVLLALAPRRRAHRSNLRGTRAWIKTAARRGYGGRVSARVTASPGPSRPACHPGLTGLAATPSAAAGKIVQSWSPPPCCPHQPTARKQALSERNAVAGDFQRQKRLRERNRKAAPSNTCRPQARSSLALAPSASSSRHCLSPIAAAAAATQPEPPPTSAQPRGKTVS